MEGAYDGAEPLTSGLGKREGKRKRSHLVKVPPPPNRDQHLNTLTFGGHGQGQDRTAPRHGVFSTITQVNILARNPRGGAAAH
jgi:hypothetical protein